jgi:hypothetical protein
MSNPFTPTFGVTPPVLAGRDAELAAIRRALDNGPGDPARAVLFTGARGIGKTVLLNAVEAIAREHSWAVVTYTLRRGAAAELTETILPQLLGAHAKNGSRVTGASLSVLGVGGSVSRDVTPAHPIKPSFRSELEELAQAMTEHGAGVFVSLDEVQRGSVDDLREIFHAIQHCFRQGLQVAFVAAGLPSAINAILNDDVLTYLRRSQRHALHELPRHEVVKAIRQPILDAGRTIDDDALGLALDASHGYPFFVQMMGYQLWEANPTVSSIDATQARVAAHRTAQSAAELLFAPVLADLSPGDRAFLQAMARVDQDPIPVSAIQARLDADRTKVAQWRRRLVAADVVEPAGHGRLSFAIPGLREHIATLPAAT